MRAVSSPESSCFGGILVLFYLFSGRTLPLVLGSDLCLQHTGTVLGWQIPIPTASLAVPAWRWASGWKT